jgi:hypothetical protein
MGRFDALTHLEETMEERKAPQIGTGATRNDKTTNETASLLANQQTSKLVNQQTSELVNQQTSKLANQQTSKLINQKTSEIPLSTKEKKKYGTYLREDSIMEIHILAAQAGKKDHELVQDIVDLYFQSFKK